MPCTYEQDTLRQLCARSDCLYRKVERLDSALLEGGNCSDSLELAQHYRRSVFAAMQEMRAVADEMETLLPRTNWPYPTYEELLFSV